MGSLVVLGLTGFGGETGAVPQARRYVRGLLAKEGIEAEIAALIVTELATNAVEHGGEGGFDLLVAVGPDVVRVEVSDSGKGGRPCLKKAGEEAEEGRGLLLVDGLALSWGARCEADGTVVWAEVAREQMAKGE